MITLPSTEVLLVFAAILPALMFCQWFIGGMSRRHPSHMPETEHRSSARVQFHKAA
jgi:hypothetical protein